MSNSLPLYKLNDTVYLRSSAAQGFIEPVIVSRIASSSGNWIYSITFSRTPSQTLGTYTDKNSLITGQTMYFREDEFVDYCVALNLAKIYHTAQLDSINKKLADVCVTTA